MSRTLTGIARSEADKALGTEPITIVAVQWNGTKWYADKELAGLSGKILSASGIDSIIKLKRGGAAGSVSIELDDTDNTIKDIFDSNDIHKVRAQVYQSFDYIDGSDTFANKFLILSGRVETPISWSEGERKLTIEIVSELEDAEIGFSPEEGAFPNMADSAIGKAWPLCFGSPVRVPAVKVIEQTRGTSLTRYGLISRSEVDELCGKAVTLAIAQRAKDTFIQNQIDALADIDIDPLSDEDYEEGLAGVINSITTAYVNLLNFQELLIFANPDQEDNVNAYAELCVELNDAEAALAAAQLRESELQDELLNVQIEVQQAQTALDIQKWLFQQDPLDKQRLRDYSDALGTLHAARLAVVAKEEEIVEFGDTVLDAQKEVDETTEDKAALKNDLFAWTLETIEVDGGEKFPQGEIEIIVQGVRLEGSFSDRTFTISKSNIPTYSNLTFAARQRVTPNLFWLADLEEIKGHYCLIRVLDAFSPNHRVVFIQSQNGTRCAYNPVVWEALDDLGEDFEYYRADAGNGFILETSPIFLERWDQFFPGSPHITGLENLPDNDWQLNIGDTVYLFEDYHEKYVANLIASTSVHEVFAERTVNGETRLQPIPRSYYIVNLGESIAGQIATTIKFRRPLSAYMNEGWSDQIYVTLTSSEGPNTVDIIEYLIDTYSIDLVTDTSTFASVSTAIANYPSDFAILNRKNLLATIEDIAWQARCAVFVRNGVTFIKYLAVRSAPIVTLTEQDIDFKTIEVSFFTSENLVTRLVAKWQPDYFSEELEIILRNNIGKYGDLEESFSFWIYNRRSLIEKSAQFWLIRYSNSWKRLKFTTPLHLIQLESLDTIQLALNQAWIANESVRGEIQTAQLNTDDFKMSLDLWIPVRGGEMSEYTFAYPASASENDLYPTPLDLFAGGSSNGQPAQASVFLDESRPPDLGPKSPSDTGDVIPVSPVLGRNQLDYIIHDQRDSDDQGVGITEIDIRTTPIIDSIKGTSTTMDTMLALAADEGETKLSLNADAVMTGLQGGETQIGQLEHRFDDPNWRPAAAFLQE